MGELQWWIQDLGGSGVSYGVLGCAMGKREGGGHNGTKTPPLPPVFAPDLTVSEGNNVKDTCM